MATEDQPPMIGRIRGRMKTLGLTAKRVASMADLNETYVRDILKGKSKNPRMAHLKKLATALGCDISELTNIGAVTGEQPSGDPPYSLEERALIRMWRILSEEAHNIVLDTIDKLVPTKTLRRKTDD